jgi:hypothetical protein
MATNYASASYQEILDVNTVKGNVTVIGIHTPTGNTPVRRLSGFFSQFRKFRYKGCSVQVVPAATLPADPLQVGFEAGENTIDMRDMLNPILFHGTHGESLQIAWNNIFVNPNRYDSYPNPNYNGYIEGAAFDATDLEFGNTTLSTIETQYYQAITDRSWRKFGIQSTFKLPFMSPRVWKASTIYPILQNGGLEEGSMNTGPNYAGGTLPLGSIFDSGNGKGLSQEIDEAQHVLDQKWMSSGTTPLGWLPTVTFPNVKSSTQVTPAPATVLPKIFMGILVLPPSYLQELYFRVIVTHYYEFKGFTASLAPAPALPGPKGAYENAVKTTASTQSDNVEVADATLESPTANIVRVSDGVF